MMEEDEYEDDEQIEEETETEHKTRSRPTHHVTTVEAYTLPCSNNPDETSLFYMGKTTGVSSGSAWGGSQSWPKTEDIVLKLKEIVQRHNEWCDSWQLDDGTVKHGTDTFKSIVTLDGKPVLMDASQSLEQWFK